MKTCNLCRLAAWLLVIGGINWGLVGLQMLLDSGNLNVVNLLLGTWPTLEAIVYVLIGLAGLKVVIVKLGMMKCCEGGSCGL